MNICTILIGLTLSCSLSTVHAQTPQTEFTKGWLLNAKLYNGAVSQFRAGSPDVYVGGLGLNPELTVLEGHLRVGVNATAVYTGKKWSGLLGPMASFRVKTFRTNHFGSLGNLHLIAQANWGTNRQQMAGAGLGVEILSLARVGLTAQRDYRLNHWWLQSFIAIRLNRLKQTEDPYAQ